MKSIRGLGNSVGGLPERVVRLFKVLGPVTLGLLLALTAGAAPRTWSFVQDGKLQGTQSPPGTLSFKKGGRFDGDFIRLSGTNDIIILGQRDAREYSVGLSNLCKIDRDYVLQVKDSLVDEANLQGEAAARVDQARARNQAEEKARREVIARRAQEKKAEEEAVAKETAQRLATFQPLLYGRPPRSSAEFSNYLLARQAVGQVARAGNPIYAGYARQILALSDDITNAKLNGLQNVVETKAGEIVRLLGLLFDANVL